MSDLIVPSVRFLCYVMHNPFSPYLSLSFVARYSLCVSFPLRFVHSVRKLNSVLLKDHGLKLPDGLLILCRNFHSMRIHVHPHNTYDTDSLKELLENKFLAEKVIHLVF